MHSPLTLPVQQHVTCCGAETRGALLLSLTPPSSINNCRVTVSLAALQLKDIHTLHWTLSPMPPPSVSALAFSPHPPPEPPEPRLLG